MDNQYLSQQERKSQRNRKIMTWVGTIIVLGGSFFGIYKLSQSDKGAVLGSNITVQDYKIGPDNAKVKLVEYSDFQCPACAAYSAYVDRLIQDEGDKMQFVYRNFPLVSIHKNSLAASYAAEAAGQQGKFFDMEHVLFSKQAEWSALQDPKPMFLEYAKSLNLDTAKFTSDMNNKSIKDKVQSDLDEATKMGLNSTPTFFINDKKVAVPPDYEGFKAMIDAELNK
ncbi:MAG: DsbA family protein [Acidobacteriaceae bacterium]